MARVENTSGRRYEINWKGAQVASIPRCEVDQVTGARTNGSADIADDVLDEILGGDDWTKAVFASGDLVRVGAPIVAGEDAPAPVIPAPASDKGKQKR